MSKDTVSKDTVNRYMTVILVLAVIMAFLVWFEIPKKPGLYDPVYINLHDQSMTKATVKGVTLILERKLQVPGWAEDGRYVDNMELWAHLDHVSVRLSPVPCYADNQMAETRDCVLFDAVGAYTPGKGLKSMKINKIVVKVSNKEHYDRWMQTINEAKKESFSPQIEN